MPEAIHAQKHSDVFTPVLLDASRDEDFEKLQTLIQTTEGLSIFDEIRSQVSELIKSRNATITYKGNELMAAVDDFFAHLNSDRYGNWCYYPWNKTLVHILPEPEFIEVRTNRNKNKITQEEQLELAKRKVGIIGLSVGQSVATTLALERICGELRIADFDILELSNLNRIRTPLRNLGLNKTVSVAREIAEIDPYLKVICIPEGITVDNLDHFILDGGKLDVLIDESDGLEIKIRCRERAKHFGVPVLMEASERGVVDVERFDLEPERPILHGYLEGMDMEAAKRAVTNEEKMPFMMQIVGLESLSDRMKASMLEISQSLTTWPQLASAVTYGGGMTADICRRLLLGQYKASGRYIVDIADLVNDDAISLKPIQQSHDYEVVKSTLAFNHLENIPEFEPGLDISSEMAETLVRAACMAPSGGNSQPWKWIYHAGILRLYHEIDISTQWLDYRHRGAHISFGAALENLKLEAWHQGYQTRVHILPEEDALLVALIAFESKKDSTPQMESWYRNYYPLMHKRMSNRYLGNEKPIPIEVIQQLSDAANEIPGAQLTVIHDRDQMLKMSKIVGVSERLLLTHEVSHKEFYHEIKWSKEEAEKTRVGIDIRTVELTATEMAGFNLARNWSVVKNLLRWGGGGAFEKLGTKMVKTSSAMALLTVPHYARKDFIEGGSALQRVWMKANAAGLGVQPMSAAIFLWARLVHGEGEGLTPRMILELEAIRKEYLGLFQTDPLAGEVFLFRLFYSKPPEVSSFRKHLNDVFEYRA